MAINRFPNYILDTNQLRPLLDATNANHQFAKWHYERTPINNIWIPVVTVVESIQGHVNAAKKSESIQTAKRKYDFFASYFAWLSKHQILEFNDECCMQYDKLRKPSQPVGENDKRIAACVLAYGYKLATSNQKHFIMLGVPPELLVDWSLNPSSEGH